jgi:hypothetical protein
MKQVAAGLAVDLESALFGGRRGGGLSGHRGCAHAEHQRDRAEHPKEWSHDAM